MTTLGQRPEPDKHAPAEPGETRQHESRRRLARAAKQLLPCAVLAVLMLGPSLVQICRMTWQQHALDQRLRGMQHRQVDRLQLYDRLRHDDVYVEGLIRSTFRQSKPGELVIPTDPSPASRSPRRIEE